MYTDSEYSEIIGVNLYDTIKDDFLTDNYFINCVVISLFLAIVGLVVLSPLILIKKVQRR